MAYKFKVIIPNHRFPDVEIERQVLAGVGVDLVVGHAETEEQIIEVARDADGILNAFTPITATVIASLERCRVIVRYGVGLDNIDVTAAARKGILVSNVPDYCIEEVSDHAMALILCLARKLLPSVRRVQAGEWSLAGLRPLRRISGQVLGIVGLGRIGSMLATKARHLGFSIIAYDPYIRVEVMEREGIRMASLEDVMKEADFVSLHMPLNPETRGLIGEKQIGLMKPTACLINVSRGLVVDQKALVEALQEKRIAGAGLDVLIDEPPDRNNPLLKMDSVVVTAHTAWYSEEAMEELRYKAAKKIAAVLSELNA